MKSHKVWRGHALRYGRFSDTNQVYLITTVTDKRYPLFEDFHVGRILVRALYSQQDRAITLAFVVMPDHLHWLVQLKSGKLSELVKKLKGTSSRHINQYLDRKGTIWQAGFYDVAIRHEAHCLRTARYIVANPLRAGLVEAVTDYPLWDAIWL